MLENRFQIKYDHDHVKKTGSKLNMNWFRNKLTLCSLPWESLDFCLHKVNSRTKKDYFRPRSPLGNWDKNLGFIISISETCFSWGNRWMFFTLLADFHFSPCRPGARNFFLQAVNGTRMYNFTLSSYNKLWKNYIDIEKNLTLIK